MWIDKVQDFLNQLPQNDEEKTQKNEDFFYVQLFFEKLNLRYYNEEEQIYLDILVKKLEVSKKLYKLYNKKTFISFGSDQVPSSFLSKVFCHYLGVFLQSNDYKFLNTLLKLNSNALALDWQPPIALKVLFEEFLIHGLQRN